MNSDIAKVDNGTPAITYELRNPHNVKELANELAEFIKDNKLSTKIQGKDFVNVEGWQYAGAQLGIFPVVKSIENISVEGEIKYEASVELKNIRTGEVVGAGWAICSNKESGKKFFVEYAIASMAQTRAIGKAFRSILSWIITVAGYNPTPAEEMDFDTEYLTNLRDDLLPKLAKCNNKKEVGILWESYPSMAVIKEIQSAFSTKLKGFAEQEKAGEPETVKPPLDQIKKEIAGAHNEEELKQLLFGTYAEWKENKEVLTLFTQRKNEIKTKADGSAQPK